VIALTTQQVIDIFRTLVRASTASVVYLYFSRTTTRLASLALQIQCVEISIAKSGDRVGREAYPMLHYLFLYLVLRLSSSNTSLSMCTLSIDLSNAPAIFFKVFGIEKSDDGFANRLQIIY